MLDDSYAGGRNFWYDSFVLFSFWMSNSKLPTMLGFILGALELFCPAVRRECLNALHHFLSYFDLLNGCYIFAFKINSFSGFSMCASRNVFKYLVKKGTERKSKFGV